MIHSAIQGHSPLISQYRLLFCSSLCPNLNCGVFKAINKPLELDPLSQIKHFAAVLSSGSVWTSLNHSLNRHSLSFVMLSWSYVVDTTLSVVQFVFVGNRSESIDWNDVVIDRSLLTYCTHAFKQVHFYSCLHTVRNQWQLGQKTKCPSSALTGC